MPLPAPKTVTLDKTFATKATGAFDLLFAEIQKKQEAYHTKHGKYFQSLVTPTSKVLDGADSTFVKRVPTDEKHMLDAQMTYSVKIPFQARIDEWVNDKGTGYKVIATITRSDGAQYERVKDSKGKDTGWKKVIVYT